MPHLLGTWSFGGMSRRKLKYWPKLPFLNSWVGIKKDWAMMVFVLRRLIREPLIFPWDFLCSSLWIISYICTVWHMKEKFGSITWLSSINHHPHLFQDQASFGEALCSGCKSWRPGEDELVTDQLKQHIWRKMSNCRRLKIWKQTALTLNLKCFLLTL